MMFPIYPSTPALTLTFVQIFPTLLQTPSSQRKAIARDSRTLVRGLIDSSPLSNFTPNSV